MPSINFDHHTQFFTSTIFQWKHLLKDDAYKQIIIDSLLFLKKGSTEEVFIQKNTSNKISDENLTDTLQRNLITLISTNKKLLRMEAAFLKYLISKNLLLNLHH